MPVPVDAIRHFRLSRPQAHGEAATREKRRESGPPASGAEHPHMARHVTAPRDFRLTRGSEPAIKRRILSRCLKSTIKSMINANAR